MKEAFINFIILVFQSMMMCSVVDFIRPHGILYLEDQSMNPYCHGNLKHVKGKGVP